MLNFFNYLFKKNRLQVIFLCFIAVIIILGISSQYSFVQHPSVNPFADVFWWKAEYRDLVQKVDQSQDSSLSTPCKFGPNDSMKMELSLSKDPENGFILRMNYPKGAMFSVDQQTGEMEPSETDRLMIIRDHDLDAIPDDFYQSSGIYGKEISEDDFIPFNNRPYYRAILIQWSMGIGYAVNYHLHNVESALPIKQ